jgi:hypothetical protein
VKPLGPFLLIISLFSVPALFSQEPEGPGPGGFETARREELIRRLTREGIPFEQRPLFAGYGGFGSSLLVSIPARAGSDGDATEFVLAIPLSASDDPGAGFPWGIEGGLRFIRKLMEEGTNRDVVVAFLGDEQSLLPPDVSRQSHTGLKDLISLRSRPENTALLYLDCSQSPETLIIHHGGNKTLAPLQIIEAFYRSCTLRDIPAAFAVQSNVWYKLDIIRGPAALELSLGGGIPSLAIRGKGAGGISADVLGDLLLEYTRFPLLSGKDPDLHYSIFRLFGTTFFLSEAGTLAVIWIVTALFFLIFLVYSIVSRGMLSLQWQVFLRRSWVIPLVFALSALSLGGADFFITLILRVFSLPMDRIYPGAAALTLAAALVLLSLADPLLEGVRISRKAGFYGNAAVVVIILESLAAALMDITFMPAFIWAFLFTLLAALIPRALPVYAVAFITPLQAAVPLIAGLASGYSGLQELFRSSRLWLILILALLSLPPVLLFYRAQALRARTEKSRRPSRKPRLILLGIVAGAAIPYAAYLVWRSPPAPVRRIIPAAQEGSAALTVTLSQRIFLQRRLLEIRVEAPGQPVRLDLALDYRSGPSAVYTAPMPYVLREHSTSDGGKENSVEFILGENPPNPFTTDLVLPLTFQGSLRVEALYLPSLGVPRALEDQGPEEADAVLRLRRTIPISR